MDVCNAELQQQDEISHIKIIKKIKRNKKERPRRIMTAIEF
jgi:hypothetical protein